MNLRMKGENEMSAGKVEEMIYGKRKDMIEQKENGKIVVQVPVSYIKAGDVEMEFDSIEDMRLKLSDAQFVDQMPLPDEAEYVDASYEVDTDSLDAGIELFQKPIDFEAIDAALRIQGLVD